MDSWKERVYCSYMSNGFRDTHKKNKDFELQNKYFKRNYLKYMPKDKDKKILDLGCGMGHFLYFCQKLGYVNCSGVDISTENVEFVKKMFGGKIKIYASSFVEFLKDKENSYDVIVMNDVIEHLTRPEIFEVLDMIMQALTPEGVLIIKTFNMANPYVSITGRYIDITHEVTFTEKSMRQVLRATNFKNIQIVGTDIYVLNPIISIVAKVFSKIINLVLFILSALYGRTTNRIFEKDMLAIGYKSSNKKSN